MSLAPQRGQDLLVALADGRRQPVQPCCPERRYALAHAEYSVIEPDHDAVVDQPIEGTDQMGLLAERVRVAGPDSHLKRQLQRAHRDRTARTLEVS